MNDLERLNNAAKGLKSSNARVLAALQELENATKNLIKVLKCATIETRLHLNYCAEPAGSPRDQGQLPASPALAQDSLVTHDREGRSRQKEMSTP